MERKAQQLGTFTVQNMKSIFLTDGFWDRLSCNILLAKIVRWDIGKSAISATKVVIQYITEMHYLWKIVGMEEVRIEFGEGVKLEVGLAEG